MCEVCWWTFCSKDISGFLELYLIERVDDICTKIVGMTPEADSYFLKWPLCYDGATNFSGKYRVVQALLCDRARPLLKHIA